MPDVIVVPVKRPVDMLRVGRVASVFATALSLPLQFLNVVLPDDDLTDERSRFASALTVLQSTSTVDMSIDVVVGDRPADVVVERCSDAFTCMATSASPFRDHHYVGSCAAALLAVSRRPVVLVGPAVEADALIDGVRCVAAAAQSRPSEVVLSVASDLAEALDDSRVARLSIDPTGVVYEHDYEDQKFDRPQEIHARIRADSVGKDSLGEVLAEASNGALLVVATRARAGLAWICEGSVAFDAVRHASMPVVALGPHASGEIATNSVDGNDPPNHGSTIGAAGDRT